MIQINLPSLHRKSGVQTSYFAKALIYLCLSLSVFVAGPAWGVNPDEVLEDPALESRARALSTGLRCMVCQNQSIDDSDAELARDLRLLVRERLQAGDSDDQVIDYIVARYGEYVLLKPRFDKKTLLLWGFPLIMLVGGIGFIVFNRRKAHSSFEPPVPLSEAEKVHLEQLLQDQSKN